MTQSFLFYTTEPTLCTACPGVYQANQVFDCPIDTINIKNSCHITHGIKLFSFLQLTSPQPILQGLQTPEATVLSPPYLPTLPSFVEANTVIQKGAYAVISH